MIPRSDKFLVRGNLKRSGFESCRRRMHDARPEPSVFKAVTLTNKAAWSVVCDALLAAGVTVGADFSKRLQG